MVKEAKKAGVKKIVQVGDFGLWSHELNGGVSYLDQLNEAAREAGVKIYALGGNHENWDHWNWHLENSPKSRHGFAHLRTHILLAPRVHYFEWEGSKMLIVAGAVSIDQRFRVPGESWWPQEATTDEEVAMVHDGKVDFLFTHDCSNRTPFKGDLNPDLDSQMNRQRIDEVLRKSRPHMQFHGHMHTKYVWENMVTDLDWTKTIGLDMDGTWYSWGILDLESREFLFRNEFGVDWNRLST